MNKTQLSKPKIAMDISTTGKGGGPYTSTRRIMTSALTNDFSFHEITYNPDFGRGISIRRILDIRRQIICIEPNIVHFTGLQLSGFHMAVACWLAGVRRSVVTIRGSSADALNFSSVKKLIVARLLEPLTLLLSTRIVGVSDYVTSTKVPKMFSKKVVGTIYNFPPPRQSPPSSSLLLRDAFGFSSQDIVVISIGRINRDKGSHILESAIEKLRYYERIKFLVVGDGEYRLEMQANLSEQINLGKVKFLGYRDDVLELNKLADIFVLPTLHETLSNALLEASYASLPIIASKTGGVPEIVETGFNGILVPPGDIEELTNAIAFLASDEEQRATFAKNAEKLMNRKFSEVKITEQLKNVYTELLLR